MENLEKMDLLTIKVSKLKKQIEDELSMIKDYESNIDDLEEEIREYDNEYDYENDPNGNDYDLHYVNDLRDEIEVNNKLISRCEWEIQICEEELNQIEFWLGDSSVQILLQKWETKLNGYINQRNDIELDYRNGDYQSEEDYQSDISNRNGKIEVTNQIIEDIKHLIEKTELKLN
jgi:hypothetical protein